MAALGEKRTFEVLHFMFVVGRVQKVLDRALLM